MSAPPPSGSVFGAPAQRRPLAAEADCPCGGGPFGDCCRPILAGEPAPTAVALMRSRYTAFALCDAAHLAASWHPSTRPTRLDLDGDLRWLSLSIEDVVAGQPGDRRGIVAFRARWQDGDVSGELAERSRFVFQHDAWWYVEGEVDGSTTR